MSNLDQAFRNFFDSLGEAQQSPLGSNLASLLGGSSSGNQLLRLFQSLYKSFGEEEMPPEVQELKQQLQQLEQEHTEKAKALDVLFKKKLEELNARILNVREEYLQASEDYEGAAFDVGGADPNSENYKELVEKRDGLKKERDTKEEEYKNLNSNSILDLRREIWGDEEVSGLKQQMKEVEKQMEDLQAKMNQILIALKIREVVTLGREKVNEWYPLVKDILTENADFFYGLVNDIYKAMGNLSTNTYDAYEESIKTSAKKLKAQFDALTKVGFSGEQAMTLLLKQMGNQTSTSQVLIGFYTQMMRTLVERFTSGC